MMGSTTRGKSEEELKKERGFIDVVFSWSLSEVLNINLYRTKVREIPKTFSSIDGYLKSFIFPLLEETRADLQSNMSMLSSAPVREVYNVRKAEAYKPPKDFLYEIRLHQPSENENSQGLYAPQGGDLIALTERRPKCIDDLNTPRRPYLIALVRDTLDKDSNYFVVLSANFIDFEKEKEKEKDDKKEKRTRRSKLFIVYLANMTTNLRIWAALNSDQQNVNIIKNVLQSDCSVGPSCACCSSEVTESTRVLSSKEFIRPFNLDQSQEDAVLGVIATRECHHHNMVKLIWGPPGTGKTKTVGSLLFALLKLKCRTLTCAPTNVAVVGVASRLMSFVKDNLENYPYGLGDIVLVGNSMRMKIDDHEGLSNVFLDKRVDILKKCFAPLTGWKSSLETMLCLLEDPEEQYKLYLKSVDEDVDDTDSANEFDELINLSVVLNHEKEDLTNGWKFATWNKMVTKMLKEKKKKKNLIDKLEAIYKNMRIGLNHEKDGGKSKIFFEMVSKVLKEKEEKGHNDDNVFTFEEFFLKTFNLFADRLMLYIPYLYTHLPTCLIMLEVMKYMMKVVDMLKTIGALLKDAADTKQGLREKLKGTKLSSARLACLQILKILQGSFSLPICSDLRNLCLKNTCLIFCTASSSAKLHTEGANLIELVVIDEAAQLKECESTIPLQLPSLRHAILVGDERQLPAMVQSKICEKALFGRSLFERLVVLGHPKHLLSVQYRMHPSISQFPNTEFYGNKIKDGPNVIERSYEKRFLKGNMFGPLSFINVTQWKEDQDNGFSRKNLLEVAVVAELVASLFKESKAKKQKVSVGCISPYKAQVFAMKDKLGNLYSADTNSDFSVKVNSVDGFQGSEEDVIIISTVRSNGSGSIGFLSNFQRTNVALTRARYCLWVLGNEATLVNSGSVWKKLVVDAKSRECFYNANEDKNLDKAIKSALLDLGQVDTLFNMDSLLSKESKWKLCFSDEFVKSMKTIKDSCVRDEIVSLLTKLSSGWRPSEKDNTVSNVTGTCTLLMELHNVNGEFVLIWTVDILRESSKDIQVLKVWEILRKSRIPQFANHLNNLFGKYTMNYMSRCQVRQVEGNLVVPMTWPVESNAFSNAKRFNGDPSLSLSTQLAGLGLKNGRGKKS